jgi:hypothetical protein
MNWLKAIDLDQASKNVHQDFIGDWYRDPWGWPEIDFVCQTDPSILEKRADTSGVCRVANVDVPKEGFSPRPAIVMDPVDRLLYQGLVDRVSKSVTDGLEPWVYGWRLRRKDPKPGVVSRNSFEWEAQHSRLSSLVGKYKYGFKTDIVSCFASMPVSRVVEDMQRKASSSTAIVDRLGNMLEHWDAAPGRRGLPQRSAASALLANMYLMNLDEIVSAYNSDARQRKKGPRDLSTRWMDDLWVFGNREGRLRALQVDLQEAARGLGLELHAAKTGIYDGTALAKAALQSNHSAVDSALIGPDFAGNLVPLEELVDELLVSPETADRSSIHFACVRLRRHGMKAQASSLLEQAKRMPHAADHLSRLAKDLGLWTNYSDWYGKYVQSNWARFDWTKAQLATMFPSKAKVGRPVIDALATELVNKPELPLLAVCIQRLISWDRDTARDLIRDLAIVADHPLERRLLALGSLTLREPRQRVRDLLTAYSENQVTLQLVQGRSFRPFPVESDFR